MPEPCALDRCSLVMVGSNSMTLGFALRNAYRELPTGGKTIVTIANGMPYAQGTAP
jgi:hypothetical protein